MRTSPRSVQRHLALPLSRRHGERSTVGSRRNVGGDRLWEVLEVEGLVHQAQGTPGRGLPGSRGLVAPIWQGCLPLHQTQRWLVSMGDGRRHGLIRGHGGQTPGQTQGVASPQLLKVKNDWYYINVMAYR